MSWLNWFHRKATAQAVVAPAMASAVSQPRGETQPDSNAESRKAERLERRELLYGVVRESMVHAGVLSAGYKFKVLSLDSGGRQYMIMMDLVHELEGGAARQAEIEAAIVQGASTRYAIGVTAVYWRLANRLTAQADEKVEQEMVSPPIRTNERADSRREATGGEKVAAVARRATKFTGFEDTELMADDAAELPRSHSPK